MNTYTYHHRLEPAEFPDYDTAHEADRAPVIKMSARQVADLAELLEEVDRFLRVGHGIDGLAEFYRSQGEDPSPRFTASALVDQVGLTALGLRHRVQQPTPKEQTSEQPSQ